MGGAVRAGRRRVKISNPDKVLFGDDGITKSDLARYYARVAPAMLPYVRRRPAHMHRFPDGLGGEDWVQKNVPDYFPDWVERVTVPKRGGHVTHPVIDDAATLVYLAGQGTITPHVWTSRVDRIDHPDLLILDLDPARDEFGQVRDAARLARAAMEEIGLPAFLKTTGSRGLHLVAPLDRSATFEEVKRFGRDMAALIAARDPKRLTIETRKQKRRGRLFIDWLRNRYAQTTVPPYAVRALPGAPVATPIDWDELGRVRPRSYDIESVLRRLDSKGDPWRGMWRRARSLTEPRRKLDRLLADANLG
jgi:bifunctional non-homologous end joining protein LigD